MLLLRPEWTTRAVIVCVLLYAMLRIPILTGLRAGEDLFMDSTEAFGWGQHFLAGYGRHPPMTGWIAGVWYRLFPASNWASYALSSVMSVASLLSIYLIARRALDRRRAAFVVFVMLLYPLFHIRANRFSNYQVLLALLPLLVLVFLIAYERRTPLWGGLLGLVAAAATLTMYSAPVGLFAVGLAAALHPARGRFFSSPTPYVAGAVYLLALAPHVVWLAQSDFVAMRYAEANLKGAAGARLPLWFLAHHAALLAVPLLAAAIALWPWRSGAPPADQPRGDRLLVIVIVLALVATPPFLAVTLEIGLKPDWGIPFFALVPLMLLALVPRLLVTRRAVTSVALTAACFTTLLLAAAAASPMLKFDVLPVAARHWTGSQLARELTQIWRSRFASPFPLVVGELSVASAVTFYSPDHPHMFVDFEPAFSPWIDFPSELRRKGFIGVCAENDRKCLGFVEGLSPAAERADVTLSRRIGGAVQTRTFHVAVVPPGS